MLQILKERWYQKHRTLNFPQVQPTLSPRFCGKPAVLPGDCPTNCTDCLDICPTKALHKDKNTVLVLDMGKCIFCAACRDACPQKKIDFTAEYKLATRQKHELFISPQGHTSLQAEEMQAMAAPIRDLRIFASSFKLRQVSAGGCNACEADCNVLTTLVFDLGRFGIDFVASPRHADALVITGPVSENMRQALIDTYDALPSPRAVVAVGACAISGGLFQHSNECHNGVSSCIPVDCYVPGCPPNPWSILHGLLLCCKK